VLVPRFCQSPDALFGLCSSRILWGHISTI
jgi:hypothetical protein